MDTQDLGILDASARPSRCTPHLLLLQQSFPTLGDPPSPPFCQVLHSSLLEESNLSSRVLADVLKILQTETLKAGGKQKLQLTLGLFNPGAPALVTVFTVPRAALSSCGGVEVRSPSPQMFPEYQPCTEQGTFCAQ